MYEYHTVRKITTDHRQFEIKVVASIIFNCLNYNLPFQLKYAPNILSNILRYYIPYYLKADCHFPFYVISLIKLAPSLEYESVGIVIIATLSDLIILMS